MTRPWIVLGGGGHASVVIDTLLLLGQRVLGYTDPAREPRPIPEVDCLGDDDVIGTYNANEVLLANGLGSTGSTERRAALYQRFALRGYTFSSIVHPSAVVARSTRMGTGVQVMAGAILQPGCRLADNVLVNTRASVDHDCVIGNDVHIAPGATVSGGVTIEWGTHVGTGANIVQGVCIGSQSVIGAGTLVLHDVRPGATIVGVPGREKGL